MYKILLFIFLFFVTLCSYGQVYNFKNYFVDDGLAQSQITDIDSDSDGNLWLATYGGGVDRFDGVNFHNFGLKEGLPHHQVKDIYVDSSRVWVGLQKGGCCIIENEEVFHISNIDLEKSTVNVIKAFNGFVYVGTEEGYLYRISDDLKVDLFYSFNNDAITGIELYQEKLIVSTKAQGIWRLDDDTFSKLILLKNVSTIYVNNDKLWVGAANQLWVSHDGENFQRSKLNIKYPISDISKANDSGCIWVASYGGGIFKYCDNETITLKEESGLASNFCLSIYKDKFGLVWIGTDGSGLSKFMGFQFTHYAFTDGHSGEAIMSILEDNNTFWFATYGSGVFRVGRNIKIYGSENYLPTDSYYSILKRSDGRLWLASKSNGVVVFNPFNQKVKQYDNRNSIVSNQLLHLSEDKSSGIIFIASRDKGLFVYTQNNFVNISKSNGLPEDHINYTFLDSNQNVWLATASSGVVKITKEDMLSFLHKDETIIRYELFNFDDVKIQPQVLTITEDKNQRIWFGLFGKGLGYISDNKIRLIQENDQLVSQNIYSLVYDEIHNKLYTGTDKGLGSITLKADSEIDEMQFFSSSDGFTGMECNRNAMFYDKKRNDIWVGTVKGVTKYSPDLYKPSEIAPKIKITSASYHNKSFKLETYSDESQINWNKVRVIPHDSAHVIINFKAIDQWRPNKVQYTWNLNGLNHFWHELTELNSVEYSYLPAGKYVFRIRAKGGLGEWSDETLSLPFIVERPFNQTAVFYILLVLLFIGLVAGYIYYRQYNLHVRNKKLREAVLERTEALNNEKLIVEQQKEELRAQTDHLEKVNKELEKLSLVASKTDNAVLIADKDGRWEWANAGFEKMYGYKLNDFINDRGDAILNSSSSNKIKHILDESIQLKKSVTYTTKGYKKDNSEMWIQSTLTPVFDVSGKLKRFVVIDSNITHIKKINNELRKLSLVASKTDNSVIMMDKVGKIKWVNDAFHRYYDLSLDEFKVLYQKKIFELHKDLIGSLLPEEILKSRKSKSFISTFVTGKGVHKWIQIVVTPVSGLGSSEDQLIAIETDITRIKSVEEEVKSQRRKSDELLLNILPEETAEELKTQGHAQPRYYSSATVLFTDFKNFTKYCEELSPKQLVDELHEYFNAFDDVVTKFYVEKIKTIGDAYMCVGGLPLKNRSHPFDVVLSALEIGNIVNEINDKKIQEGRNPWEMRMGIHTGDLVAGVVGKKKFAYDIWGDTVNVASRMEGACEVGKINISGETYNAIKDYFECSFRGKVEARSNGKFEMYFVERIRPEFSADEDGIYPNEDFKELLARL